MTAAICNRERRRHGRQSAKTLGTEWARTSSKPLAHGLAPLGAASLRPETRVPKKCSPVSKKFSWMSLSSSLRGLGLQAPRSCHTNHRARLLWVARPFATPPRNDRYLRIAVIHCVPSSLRRLRTAEIRTRSERESEMLRVVLNAWVTKTTAAEILANPATRRRQVTMTISLNPLRSASKCRLSDNPKIGAMDSAMTTWWTAVAAARPFLEAPTLRTRAATSTSPRWTGCCPIIGRLLPFPSSTSTAHCPRSVGDSAHSSANIEGFLEARSTLVHGRNPTTPKAHGYGRESGVGPNEACAFHVRW